MVPPPRLTVSHEIQVVGGRHVEVRQHLVEHRAVLRCDAGPHLKVVWRRLEASDQDAELDRFGARAKDDEDTETGHEAACGKE